MIAGRVAVLPDTERPERGTRRFIVIGPTPPPVHGVAFSTIHVLEGMRRCGALADHLETGEEKRLVHTAARFRLLNAWYAVKHAALLAVLLARNRDADVYLPISQGRWGFIRDSVFIALARIARRRTVVHLHGGHFRLFYEEAGRGLRGLIVRALALVDEAWVLTPAHLDMFEGLVDEERVRVLENAAEDMAGEPDAPEGPDSFTLLFVSALIPEKGCLDLLDAVEGLEDRAAGIRVRFVGELDESMRRAIVGREGSLRSLGVDVELAGVKMGSAKAAEYRRADVFVLPSRYPPEGQPLVLLEAMSAGLPIISTDHSGIPYTVRDGIEGLIVPRADTGALAAAIGALRDDDSLRSTLGENGRARYADRYTPEAFYASLAALLADDERPMTTA